MLIEWDPGKAGRNLKKHKISFDEAVTVFFDPLSASFSDPDHSKAEERYIVIGFSSQNNLLVVSYVERGSTLRIISARNATMRERERHEEQR
jgi:uncharacterized protein